MFTRVLKSATTRNLLRFPQICIVTQPSPRFLHVKVYDKDAGLTSQREINRIKQLAEEKDEGLDQFRNKELQTPQFKNKDEKVDNKLSELKVANELSVDPDIFGNNLKEPLPVDEGLLYYPVHQNLKKIDQPCLHDL